MAYKKAEFRTAYLQREIPVFATVQEDLEVGALCTYNGTTIAGASAAAVGSYIVAQSDMTLNVPVIDGATGFVKVENVDKYDPKVKASTTPKNVALFLITDVSDVIVKN